MEIKNQNSLNMYILINLNTAILSAIARTDIFQQSISNKHSKFLEGDYCLCITLLTIQRT